jgi:hypothetical protein
MKDQKLVFILTVILLVAFAAVYSASKSFSSQPPADQTFTITIRGTHALRVSNALLGLYGDLLSEDEGSLARKEKVKLILKRRIIADVQRWEKSRAKATHVDSIEKDPDVIGSDL